VPVPTGGSPSPEVSIVDRNVSVGFGLLFDAKALVISAQGALPLRLDLELAVNPVPTIG